MSGKKCKHCGCSEIEVDPARGDAVCTNCGTVLEDNIIVSEVEFQENAHGGSSAIGQFVSAESKGGATGFGRAFNVRIGQESREMTLRKAREGITALCQQLRLNQQCVDIACNFYKMALSRHLTIGRASNLTQAACVYMTCRTEGTSHLLIDVGDAVPVCCFQLGRTYFKLSKALCIIIPPMDPCLFILRFASQLQFGDKQHEVSMTALRLVQRMKRDSIHSGRRPSGICGAALLIAARLHDFSRTPADVVRIVKVHESTLRKRLLEFGDTPSSALTVDEFMTVDLEEEQDPPAFKAARKRDKERLQKLMEEEDGERDLTELQKEIEAQLDRSCKRKKKGVPNVGDMGESTDLKTEHAEALKFAAEPTINLIEQITNDGLKKSDTVKANEKLKIEKGLAPDLGVIGLGQTEGKNNEKFLKPEPKSQFSKDLVNAEDLIMDEKDEEYLDELIMTEEESRHKTILWTKINSGYLKEQEIRRELKEKEKEENKTKKKVRGAYKKKVAINAATAGEAVEKMLAGKRISLKINYDILKSLDNPGTPIPAATTSNDIVEQPSTNTKPPTPSVPLVTESPIPRKKKKTVPVLPVAIPDPVASPAPPTPATPAPSTPAEIIEDFEDEIEPEPIENNELSLAAMLQNGQDDDYYDYEEY